MFGTFEGFKCFVGFKRFQDVGGFESFDAFAGFDYCFEFATKLVFRVLGVSRV